MPYAAGKRLTWRNNPAATAGLSFRFMHRSTPLRRLAALLAIAALVFAQAVTAAHACMLPAPLDRAAAPVDRAAALAGVSAAPCHEPDEPASDALCKAHCEAGTQTVDQAKPLPTPALGAPLLVLRADDLARTSADATARLTDWLAHAGAPPPRLLHRRLRI